MLKLWLKLRLKSVLVLLDIFGSVRISVLLGFAKRVSINITITVMFWLIGLHLHTGL